MKKSLPLLALAASVFTGPALAADLQIVSAASPNGASYTTGSVGEVFQVAMDTTIATDQLDCLFSSEVAGSGSVPTLFETVNTNGGTVSRDYSISAPGLHVFHLDCRNDDHPYAYWDALIDVSY